MTDVRSVLDAISSALSVVQTVANTPGVNMIPYVSTVSGAISALQFAYKAGINITDHVAAIKDTFEDGVPTQEQLDALDTKIAELRAELHAPLPEKEDGEPD